MEKFRVGIIGATGMVGQRFVLLTANHPWFTPVVLAASTHSAGKTYAQALGEKWHMADPIPESVKSMIVMDAEADAEEIAKQVDFVFCAVNMKKDEIKALGVEGHQALHGLLSAASESRVAMRMLTRGQLRMNMEVVGSEEPMRLLSDMVNRLTMALIVVGLFVGSSIVYYAGMKPIIFGIPVVGFMGYVIAFILSAWIVFDIYFKGRRSKRR